MDISRSKILRPISLTGFFEKPKTIEVQKTYLEGILKFLVFTKKSNGKGKTKAQVIFYNSGPFAHRANGSLPFIRLLRRNKQKLPICKRTKRTCPAMLRRKDSMFGSS